MMYGAILLGAILLASVLYLSSAYVAAIPRGEEEADRDRRQLEVDSARAEKEAVEEGDGPPISWVQDEVLCIIFSQLDAKTLMIVVPQVCKFWRGMCQELDGDANGQAVRCTV